MPRFDIRPDAVILLDPADNVVVCVRDLRAGDVVSIDGHPVKLVEDVALGHKIARRPIRAGEKVLRYGASIGSMICDVAMGHHVHSHNLASDYIAAHGRGGTQGGSHE